MIISLLNFIYLNQTKGAIFNHYYFILLLIDFRSVICNPINFLVYYHCNESALGKSLYSTILKEKKITKIYNLTYINRGLHFLFINLNLLL
jgi:hypothetical protein